MKEANVISLHLPLLESTRHMIDAKAFGMMQKGTILINASGEELLMRRRPMRR